MTHTAGRQEEVSVRRLEHGPTHDAAARRTSSQTEQGQKQINWPMTSYSAYTHTPTPSPYTHTHTPSVKHQIHWLCSHPPPSFAAAAPPPHPTGATKPIQKTNKKSVRKTLNYSPSLSLYLFVAFFLLGWCFPFILEVVDRRTAAFAKLFSSTGLFLFY